MINPARIIVHEPDDDFRFQIETDLKNDNRFQFLQSYKAFDKLVIDFNKAQTDIVVINWSYDQQQIIDFVAAIKMNNADLRIIIAFDFVQPDFVFHILTNGATGFLQKPFSNSDILKIISEKIFLIHPPKLAMHVSKLMHSHL